VDNNLFENNFQAVFEKKLQEENIDDIIKALMKTNNFELLLNY